jgi:hypothetical protein
MIRFLACAAALIPALTLGCDQSLFDGDPGNGQTGRDGGPPIDGNVMREDGGGGGGDGGGGGADAGREPLEPGGTYVEIYEGPEGVAFLDMQAGTWNGIEAWVATDSGTGAVRSAVVNCPSAAGSAECAGIPEGALLFVSTNDTHRPALLRDTEASEASSVTVDVNWMVVEGSAVAGGRLRFARNHPFDVVGLKTLGLDQPAQAASVAIDVVENDSVLLIPDVPAPAGGRIAMAVELTRVTGERLCRVAIPFQGDTAVFPNGCGSGGLRNQGAVQTTTGLPRGIPGAAMSFQGGSYMSYDGDSAYEYTAAGSLQFWALLDGTATAETQYLVSDLDCTQRGGLRMSYSNQMLFFEVAYEDGFTDYCAAIPQDRIVPLPAPTDGQWHLYRISWAAEIMAVCVDGKGRGGTDVLGVIGTPGGALQIGRRDDLPANFHGQIADLRVYQEPLPCVP